ncbi:SOS response-associated peptidase family protein [Chitinolyticbacter albus]|uniref:SOS response-associated peptidase family protein n=1 Tax=Chitinolyticbacter albus TaxID=2961951 RepID=UPI002108AC96|nr:SOS response-associated peptidase family protein [Chitinolyticbacter albus]
MSIVSPDAAASWPNHAPLHEAESSACGRIAKNGCNAYYLQCFGWNNQGIAAQCGPEQYSIEPGSRQLMLHRLNPGGQPSADCVWWNYRPVWANGGDAAVATATATAAQVTGGVGSFYAPWLRRQRAIMPVDGWFQWADIDDVRHAHYITARNRHPLFVAVITLFESGGHSNGPERGMAVITTDEGRIEMHENRPVIFERFDALNWIDPALTPIQAEQLMRDLARPVDDFEWWSVGGADKAKWETMPAMIQSF